MDEKKLIYCKHTVKSSSVFGQDFPFPKRASKSKGRPEASLVRAYLVPIFCTPVSCILGTWLEFPDVFQSNPKQSSPTKSNLSRSEVGEPLFEYQTLSGSKKDFQHGGLIRTTALIYLFTKSNEFVSQWTQRDC